MEAETVIAAVQAAALARDYVLALTLLQEHGLADRCIGCGGVAHDGNKTTYGDKFTRDGFKFTVNDIEVFTCKPCTEDFAQWLVDRSRDRTSSSSLESITQKR